MSQKNVNLKSNPKIVKQIRPYITTYETPLPLGSDVSDLVFGISCALETSFPFFENEVSDLRLGLEWLVI